MNKKFRIELHDEDGTKYTVALEGRLSREKMMKVIDMIDIMNLPVDRDFSSAPDEATFFGKVFKLIESSFSGGDFSSSDVAREFEEVYHQPVRLSMISTYLSRLVEKDYLRRERFGNSWVYRKVYLKPGQLADK